MVDEQQNMLHPVCGATSTKLERSLCASSATVLATRPTN